MAAVVALFPEVYVGREYGKAVTFGEIPRGPYMPPGFTSCGSGGSTIGLYVLRIIDVSLKFADVDAPLSVDPGGFGAGSTPDVVRS